MRGHLVMSVKERKRKVEFEGVRKGRMTIKEAAAKLDLSCRHCRRAYKRFCEKGDAGLLHRGSGKRAFVHSPRFAAGTGLGRYSSGIIPALWINIEAGVFAGQTYMQRHGVFSL